MRTTRIVFFIAVLVACIFAWPYGGNNYGQGSQTAQDAILMDDIKVITLSAGKQTTARRTHSVPQLKCVGGSASHRNDLYPSTVQCTNVGSDGTSVQWKCEADLNKQVKFGVTTVSCEGYRDSSDPYVLKGSCGLEYTLDTAGDYSYNKGGSNRYHQQNNYYDDSYTYDKSGSWFGSLFTFAVIAFIAFGFLKVCCSGASSSYDRNSYAHPGASTSDYSYNNGYNTGYNGYNNGYNTGYNNGYNGHQTAGGWTPGFWSGLTGGGAMGYMFGRNNNNNRQYYNQNRYTPGYSSGSPSSSRNNSSSEESRTASAYATTNNR